MKICIFLTLSLFFVKCADDDDDDNDDELFLRNGWPMKDIYVLFPAGTIVRYSHYLN